MELRRIFKYPIEPSGLLLVLCSPRSTSGRASRLAPGWSGTSIATREATRDARALARDCRACHGELVVEDEPCSTCRETPPPELPRSMTPID